MLLAEVLDYVRGRGVGLGEAQKRAVRERARLPLLALLEIMGAEGVKLRGARDNTPRAVVDLLEGDRRQKEISVRQLAIDAKLSRGNLSELLRAAEPNPTIETVVRIAVAIGLDLETVPLVEDERATQGTVSSDRMGPGFIQRVLDPEPPALVTTESRSLSAPAAATTVAVSLSAGVLLPAATGFHWLALVTSAALGTAAVGCGLSMDHHDERRDALVYSGAGLLGGTASALLLRAMKRAKGKEG